MADTSDWAQENFVSEKDSAWYARLFEEKGLKNGHVILLNSKNSPFYEQTKEQAVRALRAFPGGLQVGGSITAENAEEYLDAGASHVIVTSYVFRDGTISYEHLNNLLEAVGKKKLVLDLSCRKKDGAYYIVTDRWQKYTRVSLIEKELVALLGRWNRIPITYAGGIRSLEDIRSIKELSRNKIHITVGSALDLYGGSLEFEKVMAYANEEL